MDTQKDEQKPLELSSQLVSIITTEHYNLQTGRSMTISETTGRASLFLSTVSSTLVAHWLLWGKSLIWEQHFLYSALSCSPRSYFLVWLHSSASCNRALKTPSTLVASIGCVTSIWNMRRRWNHILFFLSTMITLAS